jgi:hypothetical protein
MGKMFNTLFHHRGTFGYLLLLMAECLLRRLLCRLNTCFANTCVYGWALTSFEGCVIVALILIFAFGPERLGRDFRSA